MAIYKRKDGGGWMLDHRYNDDEGEPKRYRRTFPTKRQASDALAELSETLQQEEDEKRRAKVPAFVDFLPTFWDIIETQRMKAITRKGYRDIVRLHLEPFFGSSKLDAIGPLMVERFKVQQMKKGLKAKTVANHLTVCSKVLRTAAKMEVIDRMPIITLPKESGEQDSQGFDFWGFEEAERFLAHVDSEPRIANWLRLAIATGLRSGELTGLQWGDVDLHKRILTVRRQIHKTSMTTPKSNRLRSVPLSDAAVAALELQKPVTFLRSFGEDDFVFVDDFGLFDTQRINDGYRRIIKAAGLKRIRIHDLRHTFASHCIMRGVPVEVLQRWLGHSDIRVTMRYAHLAEDHTHDFVRLLNLNGNSEPQKSHKATKTRLQGE